jgi:hypothetical protein
MYSRDRARTAGREAKLVLLSVLWGVRPGEELQPTGGHRMRRHADAGVSASRASTGGSDLRVVKPRDSVAGLRAPVRTDR